MTEGGPDQCAELTTQAWVVIVMTVPLMVRDVMGGLSVSTPGRGAFGIKSGTPDCGAGEE